MDDLIESHAAILNAYLSRLSLKELERLFEAHRDVLDASLNHGTLVQCARNATAARRARDAVSTILPYDRRHIEQCLRKHVLEVAKAT